MFIRINKRAKSIIINLAIFFLVYFAVHTYQTRLSPVGEAPEIKGWMLKGGVFDSLEASDKPILVHFWATWCKVCALEQSSINNISDDFRVISLASQSGGIEKVKTFVEKEGLRFPVIVDQYGAFAKQWGVVGFPSSFIVDKHNEIRFVEVGFTTEIGLKIRLWLADSFS